VETFGRCLPQESGNFCTLFCTLVLACLDAIDTKPRRYRAWAKAISFEYPHTAKALDGLADGYDRYAQREDEDAERLDWGT